MDSSLRSLKIAPEQRLFADFCVIFTRKNADNWISPWGSPQEFAVKPMKTRLCAFFLGFSPQEFAVKPMETRLCAFFLGFSAQKPVVKPIEIAEMYDETDRTEMFGQFSAF